MVSMGFCRPCIASLDRQEATARHQNQVPLFLHIFQKAEQNNLHHTPSEDVCAPASLLASVTWHDSYANSKSTTQHFPPPVLSSQNAPDLASQCDSIAYSTLAEKRITNTYTQPLLDGYLNHRKNGGTSIHPSFRNDALGDAISGTAVAKDVLYASNCPAEVGTNSNFSIFGEVVANDAICKSSSGVKRVDDMYDVFPAMGATYIPPDMDSPSLMWSKDASADASNAVDVNASGEYSFGQCTQKEVGRGDSVGAAMEESTFGDTIRGLVMGDSRLCDSTVKNDSEYVVSPLPIANSVAKVSHDEREVTQVTGFMKIADAEDGSAKEVLRETAPEQGTWGSCSTHTFPHDVAPLITRHVESSENHQAEDFETTPVEEKLIKNGGQESRRWPPGTSHSWQDLWHFQEENDVTAPYIFESDYGGVVDAVLDIAKSLPKNETLQDHLHPYAGRVDHLCGNAILYKLQKERLFVSAFSLFEWMRLHTPCLLTSRSLCTIFTISGDANMVDRALVLFNNLRHSKQLWFVQVFNALLSALSKHHRPTNCNYVLLC